jgi:phosphate transport system protein
MGEMAVAQLEAAMDVIEKRDENAAHRIIANDEAIDALEQQISHDVMRLALRGPMARDLREILAGLRIPADIERIGDYAANVAKRSIALGKVPPLPQIQGLRALGRLAAQQVRRAIAAYRDNDADAALELRGRRPPGRAVHRAVPRAADLHDGRPAQHHPVHAPAVHGQEPERVGDHATNIAENVWFLVHGEQPLPPREKRDETSSTGQP